MRDLGRKRFKIHTAQPSFIIITYTLLPKEVRGGQHGHRTTLPPCVQTHFEGGSKHKLTEHKKQGEETCLNKNISIAWNMVKNTINISDEGDENDSRDSANDLLPCSEAFE